MNALAIDLVINLPEPGRFPAGFPAGFSERFDNRIYNKNKLFIELDSLPAGEIDRGGISLVHEHVPRHSSVDKYPYRRVFRRVSPLNSFYSMAFTTKKLAGNPGKTADAPARFRQISLRPAQSTNIDTFFGSGQMIELLENLNGLARLLDRGVTDRDGIIKI